MKKITNLFALLLVVCLAFSIAACTTEENKSNVLLSAKIVMNEKFSEIDEQSTSDKVLVVGVQIGLIEKGLVMKPSDFTLEYNGTKISPDFFVKTWGSGSIMVNGKAEKKYTLTTKSTHDNPDDNIILGFKKDIADGTEMKITFKGQTVTVTK